ILMENTEKFVIIVTIYLMEEDFMEQKLLLTPGPTPIPPEVSSRMAEGMIGHRSNDFNKLMENIQPGLKTILGTKNPVAILSSSGTSALEAAIDRKSTRLNSSHVSISYAVFCLKKKKHNDR